MKISADVTRDSLEIALKISAKEEIIGFAREENSGTSFVDYNWNTIKKPFLSN